MINPALNRVVDALAHALPKGRGYDDLTLRDLMDAAQCALDYLDAKVLPHPKETP